jgi:hypothetical protein
MRYRVRFRYAASSGEVELFEVTTAEDEPRLPEHDAEHDRVAAEIASIIEFGAEITEAPSSPRIPREVSRTDERMEAARQEAPLLDE